jgi:iron complex outermembrane receptor protein
MSAKIHGSYAVRIAVAIALGTVAVIASAPQARAADADTSVNKPASDESAQLEEVTVTGSRIKRKDLASASPLITIDSEQLEQRAGLNLESFLNQLPNYNPAQTPTTENQDVQPSAVNTVGISTISLRGFGPNRSLVLIDRPRGDHHRWCLSRIRRGRHRRCHQLHHEEELRRRADRHPGRHLAGR